MKITGEDVEKTAILSRLQVKAEEKIDYAEQLSSILELAEALKKIDTADLSPTVYVLDITNVLREDEVKNQLSNEQALQNAPEKSKGYFKVPKIL